LGDEAIHPDACQLFHPRRFADRVLRHFGPRLAPGRLYDVPVRLGRLAEPARYENLNPIPVYL
jgi:hypothetical protein